LPWWENGTVTVLASIFIPFSISTSIFGMNIQELNKTGQNIGTFIITSASIFAVALTIWATLYQWSKFLHLPRQSEAEKARFISGGGGGGGGGGTMFGNGSEAAQRIGWAFRLRVLAKLLLHGHVLWCWRSGVLFSLWSGGELGFRSACTEVQWGEKICRARRTWDLKSRGVGGKKPKKKKKKRERAGKRDDEAGGGGVDVNADAVADPGDTNTHSRFAPCAYILAHLECPSTNAFSIGEGLL
jgi:hypothetical protein